MISAIFQSNMIWPTSFYLSANLRSLLAISIRINLYMNSSSAIGKPGGRTIIIKRGIEIDQVKDSVKYGNHHGILYQFIFLFRLMYTFFSYYPLIKRLLEIYAADYQPNNCLLPYKSRYSSQ